MVCEVLRLGRTRCGTERGHMFGHGESMGSCCLYELVGETQGPWLVEQEGLGWMGRFVAEGVEKKSFGGRVDGRGARYSRSRNV